MYTERSLPLALLPSASQPMSWEPRLNAAIAGFVDSVPLAGASVSHKAKWLPMSTVIAIAVPRAERRLALRRVRTAAEALVNAGRMSDVAMRRGINRLKAFARSLVATPGVSSAATPVHGAASVVVIATTVVDTGEGAQVVIAGGDDAARTATRAMLESWSAQLSTISDALAPFVAPALAGIADSLQQLQVADVNLDVARRLSLAASPLPASVLPSTPFTSAGAPLHAGSLAEPAVAATTGTSAPLLSSPAAISPATTDASMHVFATPAGADTSGAAVTEVPFPTLVVAPGTLVSVHNGKPATRLRLRALPRARNARTVLRALRPRAVLAPPAI